jgi:NAD dependent epimerase/dehydratase
VEKIAMKALVTGADGFIGSHLTEMLLAQGFKVRALAQYNSFNSRGWLDHIPRHPALEIISGDIRDPFFCDHICANIDIVFHLAALIAIPFSYRAPASYVATNVEGTLNVCNAALRQNVRRMIHTSTSEVYGTAKFVPMTEEHPLQPQSPYSASKIGADAMALSYFHSFGLPVTIARPFNTYGPRQSARAVIPTIISQLASGSKELRLGELSPTRDLNFVADTCRGFLALAEANDVVGETFNFGSGFEISVGDLARLIARLMGISVDIVQEDERRRPVNSEVNRLWCNADKASKALGFKPECTLEQGLVRTIEWFRDPTNLQKYRPLEYAI